MAALPQFESLKKKLEIFYSQVSFSSSSTLWIGVSGGADSVLLFHLTNQLFRERRLGALSALGVIHVNHGLRGLESDADESFVSKLLSSAPTIKKSFHRLQWLTSERATQANCRKKREEIFRSVLSSHDFLALAHHADDLAETIFMRILRGTGPESLLPMRPVLNQRIRPFLSVYKSEILLSMKEMNLSWRDDGSNKSSKYERNWLRNEIFPLLEAKRPGFAARLNALALDVAANQAIVSKDSPKHFFDAAGNAYYRLDELRNLSPREIHLLWHTNRDHSKALCAFFKKDSGKYQVPSAEIWSSSGLVIKYTNSPIFSSTFSSAQGAAESILGTWNPISEGLELMPFQKGNSGKLKDIFVNRRVPVFFRTAIPILQKGKIQVPAIPKSLDKTHDIQTKVGMIRFSPSNFSKEISTALQFGFD